MTTVAIVQARMGSTRLPGKVMKPILGVPMIELLLKRLSQSQRLDRIVVATSSDGNNQPLIDHVKRLGFSCEQGSEDDVLSRFLQTARLHNASTIVRITGDCPLVDPELVDQAIQLFEESDVDYCSNCSPATYPDGLDVEVFSMAALERAEVSARNHADREHVTPVLRESGDFRTTALENETDLSDLRWTVDEPEDFEVISQVFEAFAPDIYFDWNRILQLQESNPALFHANHIHKRNQGAHMSTGQKLWKRAKRVIPGGNMLLSKRAEMFLPEYWPAYFSKAKGCTVWDLDGRPYTDMSIMGVGTNILGYGNDDVDEAVKAVVTQGNMSTLNCAEEVWLAEKLIELHPWADMARFARSGGEANAIAIRIARAASGRDGVAVCGYHGWHDWYLSANLRDDDELSDHLLPGLDPKGVPKNLRDTVFPFKYNDIDALEAIVQKADIGVIKMEVVRSVEPENGFLHKVRELATRNNIVLIFDECTSGFRQTYGGIHKLYDVEPDMAMFGKALGNGYAITATIGRRDVMEAAQSTFISSTFWTERIGPAAALKTLEVMQGVQSWDVITKTGRNIQERWRQLAQKHGLSINIWGIPALAGFTFSSESALAYKTLITQEMLKQNFLASNAVYVSTAHTYDALSDYFSALDPIFSLIKECEEGRPVLSLLDGPVCHSGFSRLN